MAHRLGATVKFRVDRGSVVSVKAPDGSVVELEAPNGHFSLLLDQVGLWSYEWDGDGADARQVEVVELADQVAQTTLVEEEPVPRRVLSGRFSTGRP